MNIAFNKLIDMNQHVFRNIAKPDFDEYDDLSDDMSARAHAHRMSSLSANYFSENKFQYDAIDFIFEAKNWEATRFGNGDFPVWYGSLDLATTFYETIHRWKKSFIDAPKNFNETRISVLRKVFTVLCKAALIDLREYANSLAHPDPGFYPNTQQIGRRIHQEGYPGLLTQSARIKNGENIAIFKKEILSDPNYFNKYIYEYNPLNQQITVTDREGVVVSNIS